MRAAARPPRCLPLPTHARAAHTPSMSGVKKQKKNVANVAVPSFCFRLASLAGPRKPCAATPAWKAGGGPCTRPSAHVRRACPPSRWAAAASSHTLRSSATAVPDTPTRPFAFAHAHSCFRLAREVARGGRSGRAAALPGRLGRSSLPVVAVGVRLTGVSAGRALGAQKAARRARATRRDRRQPGRQRHGNPMDHAPPMSAHLRVGVERKRVRRRVKVTGFAVVAARSATPLRRWLRGAQVVSPPRASAHWSRGAAAARA